MRAERQVRRCLFWVQPTEHGQQAERTQEMRVAFNAMCRAFCDTHENAHFVDVDKLLDPEEFADSDHYTRTGYFKIADFVNKQAALIEETRPMVAEKAV